MVTVATKLRLLKPIMASRLADAGCDGVPMRQLQSLLVIVKVGEGIETC